MSDTIERITQYLSKGGPFNPEMAMHERVSELLIDCREELLKGESVRRKLVATHIKSGEAIERAEAAEAKVDALMQQMEFAPDVNAHIQKLEAKVDALMQKIEGWKRYKANIDEALNSGDGSYRP